MEYVIWIPLLPLMAATITLIFGRWYIRKQAHWLPCIAVFGSFLLSFKALLEVIGGARANFDLYSWVIADTFHAAIGFQIDPLSVLMLAMVSFLSFLIHVYSIGYMEDDPGYYRFFAYISLFTFSMLMLVSANNFLQLFFGWEAVGLCSYLLIGFWYQKKSAADAAKKAFIVNRFGDFGFALGVFLVFLTFGTIYYDDVFARVHEIAHTTVNVLGVEVLLATLIAVLLFCGAMGKSAQFPLHVWLPDAMEGPTPVSALIHAATMVTAGVFMVCRCHEIFELSHVAMAIVAAAGMITCFMAATIAPTQFDIKRVIAYSTLSQLGYMFMACGVGAFAAGMFHLFTHAFFKALLFLGAGSVMHAMHHAPDPTDMRYMGGLRKYMPITFATFLIASLSISGIPGLAGFFSKDEILWLSFVSEYPWGKLVWFVGTLVAGLTAFYSFRVVFMTFFGEFRGKEVLHGHEPHESPPVMTIPLMILAVGAVVTGWLGVPHVLGGHNHFAKFLEPVLGHPHEYLPYWLYGKKEWLELFLMAISVGVGVLGIAVAYVVYIKKPELQRFIPERFPALYRYLYNKWYWDEIYDATIVKPTFFTARSIVQGVIDSILIEGVVNGVPDLLRRGGASLRRLQNGVVQTYALIMATGAAIVLLLVYFF
ncbi:proton-translocating NADH-quinone oxidoreductase, chain L [Thermodesulfatator indicus DSM 15286]|uniref:Proton-translocating NADH-quinone oxidoreductase, chain L n=1 Tax=Thermodesulfatator indicus (strain DSM 15286 / JCM 11887 / CIR29812) TaxID=667014 RepID=F8A9A9_THEID|nr:NADH-quinone oxidoreductase subunit L [Thermodesulfatator indicus]AEH45493.1 proton-translocating NADH-quinone oxidoreductase, chain L [Thermodesulfatator indicus DSM 15286]